MCIIVLRATVPAARAGGIAAKDSSGAAGAGKQYFGASPEGAQF